MARIPFDQRYPEQLAALRAAYAEAHRAYHNWDHIEALLADFRRLDDAVACGDGTDQVRINRDTIPRAIQIDHMKALGTEGSKPVRH